MMSVPREPLFDRPRIRRVAKVAADIQGRFSVWISGTVNPELVPGPRSLVTFVTKMSLSVNPGLIR